jgi:hypothetical protein
MSRRARHGRNPHQHPSARPARPGTPTVDAAQVSADTRVATTAEADVRAVATAGADATAPVVDPGARAVASPVAIVIAPASLVAVSGVAGEAVGPIAPAPASAQAPVAVSAAVSAPTPVREPARAIEPTRAPDAARPQQPLRGEPRRVPEPDPARERQAEGPIELSHPTCTQAQLRRFIKSRPWVPMHELRRRFGIYGADDDVSPIRVGDRTLFIGLPPAEGSMMGELLTTGDVGCELSLDPVAPVVIGVYPMRPVPRS